MTEDLLDHPVPDQRATDPATLTFEVLADALHRCDGLITRCATYLHLDPVNLHARILSDFKLKQIVLDYREVLLDVAEEQLAMKVRAGNMRAITYTLKTLGRHRGYVERAAEEVAIPINGTTDDSLNLGALSHDKLLLLGDLLSEAKASGAKVIDVVPIDTEPE
jgi:hypothetical protein